MSENEISKIVVDCVYHIHKELGPGLLENVYEAILEKELQKRELKVSRQVRIPLTWDDLEFKESFRADLIVEDKVLIELKSVEKLHNAHKKQLLTYLKLSKKKLGLLINFSEELIKNGIVRVVNGL